MPAENFGNQVQTSSRFQDLYNSIVAANNGNAPEMGGWQGGDEQPFQQGNQIVGDDQRQEDTGPTREMTPFERLFAQLNKAGEDIVGSINVKDDEGNDVPVYQNEFRKGNLLGAGLGLVTTLPQQMLGAIPMGAASLYEGVTGKPVTEGDLDTNQIPDRDLNAAQQVGAGFSGLINTLGVGVGGSGKLLEGGANVAKQAIAPGSKMLEGPWSKAVGGITQSKLGGFAADALEEGAEEAADSLFGDLRQNSQLDEGSAGRALEAGAWGAAGGAVMSGAGMAMNKAAQLIEDQKTPQDTANDVWQPSANDPYQYLDSYKSTRGTLTPSVAAAYEDEINKQGREVPGSASFTNRPDDAQLGIDRVALGSNGIRAIFYNNDRTSDGVTSAQLIAETFGTDVDTIDGIFKAERNDPTQRAADKLNELLKAKPERAYVSAGRNPDTSPEAVYTLTIDHVFDGDGVKQNAATVPLTGSDVDGDKTQIYFKRYDFAQPPSAHMLGSDGKSTKFSLNYLGLDSSKTGTSRAVKRMREILNDKGFDKAIVDNASSSYADAMRQVRNGADGSDVAVMSSLQTLRTQMRRYVNDESADKRLTTEYADDVFNDVLNGMKDENYIDFVAKSYAKKMEEENAGVQYLRDLMEDSKADYSGIMKSGDLAGDNVTAAFFMDYGWMVSSVCRSGNPFFRQDGAMYYFAKQVKGMTPQRFADKYGDYITTDVFTQLMAKTLGLRNVGESPENSIEGVLRAWIATDVQKNGGIPVGGISSEEDVKNFKRVFKESCERYYPIYNKALKVLTDNGEMLPYTAAQKVVPHLESQAEMARAIGDIYANGSFKMNDLFNVPSTSSYYDVAIDEAIKAEAERIGVVRDQLAFNEDVQQMFYELVRDYGGKMNALSRRIETTVQEMVPSLRGMLDRAKDGKFDLKDSEQAIMVLDFIDQVIDPKVAMRMGLGDIETILSSPYGKELFSGDADRTLNAMMSASLYYQFNEERRMLAEYRKDPEGNGKWLRYAKDSIVQKGHVSPIHDEIIRQLLETDSMELLDTLCSLDISYTDKVKSLQDAMDQTKSYMPPLMAAALKTTDSEIDVTTAATRFRKASSSLGRAFKANYDYNKAVADSIGTFFEDQAISEESRMAALKSIALNAQAHMSEDVLGTFFWDQLQVAHDKVEKGTVLDSASLYYQSVQRTWNGGDLPWVAQLTGEAFGVYNAKDIANNRRLLMNAIFDPDIEYRFFVDGKKGEGVINQTEIFKSIGMTVDKDNPLRSDQVIALMKQYPQLVSWMAPPENQPGMVNGEASLNAAYSEKLDTAVKDWIQGNMDNGKTRLREYRTKVENILYRDPEFMERIAASIDNVDSIKTPAAMKRAVVAKKNEIVSAYMYAARTDENGAGWKALKASYEQTTYEDIIAKVKSFIDGCGIINRRFDIDANVKNPLIQAQLQEVNDILFIMEVGRRVDRMKREGKISAGFDATAAKLSIPSIDSDYMIRMAKRMADFQLFLANVSVQSAVSSMHLAPSTAVKDMLVQRADAAAKANPGAAQDMEAVKDMIDQVGAPTINALFGTSDSFFAYGELEGMSPNEVDKAIEKARGIIDKYAFNGEGFDESAIREAFDPKLPTSKADEMRKVVADYYNNVYMRWMLNDMMTGTTEKINPNYYQQQLESVRKFYGKVDDIRSYIQDAPQLETSDTEVNMPLAHWDNPVNAAMASASRINAQSGMVAFHVSADGMQAKICQGAALIANDLKTAAQPTEMTGKDIKENADIWEYCKYDTVNKKGEPILGVLNPSKIRKLKDDEVVRVYDPRDNIIGVDDRFVREGQYRRDKNQTRIGQIIMEMMNYAAEPRNLKLKKSAHTTNDVTQSEALQTGIVGNILDGKALNAPAGPTEVLISYVRSVRENMAAYYAASFQKEKGLNLDADDAMVVSQFLTPYLTATYRGADGQLSTSTIGMEALLDESKIDAWIDAMGGIGAVQSVQPKIMSLQQVSMKTYDYVVSKLGASDDKVTPKDLQDAAIEAYRDAASMDRKLDVSDVLGDVTYINSAMTPVIPTVDSETNLQRFMGMVEPETSRLAGERYVERPNAPQKLADDVKEISERLFGEGTSFRAFKLVNEGSDPNYNIVNQSFIDMFRGISEATRYNWTNGIVLAASREDVGKAISLASTHGCYVGINKAYVPSNLQGYVKSYVGDDKNIAVVDMREKDLMDSKGAPHQGANMFFDPKGCGINVLLGPEAGLPDAGHGYNPKFKFGYRQFTAQTVRDLRQLFDHPGSVALCDRKDVEKIAKIWASGDRSQISFKGQDEGAINEMGIDNAIEQYLDGYKKQQTTTGPFTNAFMSKDQYYGNVIGFAKTNAQGKEMYAPIVLDEVNAQYVGSIGVDMNGSNLVLNMSSILQENSERAQKWALMGQFPMKSQGSIMSDEEAARVIPTLDLVINDEQVLVKGVWDKESTKSRLFDRSAAIAQNNLYFMSRMLGVSAFHRYDKATGKWVLRDNIAKQDNAVLVSILNNEWKNGWDQVASGRFNLSDDPEINGIVRDVVRVMHLTGMDPLYFFTSMDFEMDQKASVGEGFELKDATFTGRQIPVAQNYQFFTGTMNQDQLLKLYHLLDDRLCSNGVSDPVKAGYHIFDHETRMYMKQPKATRKAWQSVIVGDFMLEDNTAMGSPSSSASMSLQHAVMRSGWKGAVAEFADDLMTNAMSKVHDYSRQMLVNRPLKEPKLTRSAVTQEEWNDTYMRNNTELSVLSAAELRYRKSIENEARTFEKDVPIMDRDGDPVNPMGAEMRSVIQRYRDATGIPDLSFKEANNLYKWYTARSLNDGKGYYEGTIDEFKDVARRIESNMRQYGIPISTKNKVQGRHCISLVSQGMAKRLWDNGVKQSGRFDGYNEFVRAMNDDMTEESKSIANEKQISTRNALERLMDISSIDHNLPVPDARVWGEMRVSEVMRNENVVINAMRQGDAALAKANRELFEEQAERSREWFAHNQEVLENHKVQRVAIDNSRSGFITRYRGDKYNTITNLMRNAATLSRTMSMMNPLLTVANVTDRIACTGALNAALRLGQYKIGPYQGRQIDQDAVRAASNDETALKIYTSYRFLTFTGDELEFLQNAKSVEAIDEFLAERHRKMGNLERFSEMVFKAASGGNFGMNWQIRNAINIFVMRASDAGHDWWFQPTGANTDETVIEKQLKANPAKFMLNMFSQNDNPDFMLWMQSMNKAKQGDMAQRNLVSALYAAACNRSSAVDFLTTTCVSKFVMYQTNVLGRVLNYVLPVSSLNYLAVETAARIAASGKTQEKGFAKALYDMGIDETLQVQANMREAILVDLCKLGVSSMAAVLAALTMAWEPPDDDAKKDDYEEWTLFGFRVKANWWLSDTLGPILPLAVTYRSILEDGKPNMNILFKGLAQCLYSNPAMKVNDIVEMLFDPEESFWEGYNMDALDFDSAKGGAPSVADYWGAQGTTWTLSWLSQFVTPSFVKEVYNNMQQYEVSYKRVFEENEAGELTEEGKAGRTEKTTYFDSQLRQISRKNPVIGFVLDMVLHPNTGYMAHEMPRTVYYDPEQLNSYKYFSMFNEDGSEKTAAQKDALALEIISILDGTDDMASLYKEGFVLSSDTRAYVATVIWDAYYKVKSQWDQMTADGDFDFKVLGDGDWSLGQQRYAKLKSAYNEELQYYKSLYYDKLYSDELNKGLAKYNRYNTTYSQDSNGDWYATGFRRFANILPVSYAPGETTAEGGYQPVMSRENDWATQSVVTGKSTGQRALIPMQEGSFDVPAFESWSGNGDGTGYSSNYRGSTTTSRPNKNAGSGYPYGYRSYGYSRRSGGSGGGGYSRRSGGSGGGGSKTIYSRLPSINMNGARTMDTTKLSDANYDYLRPGFETKGSREAYKRSDI